MRKNLVCLVLLALGFAIVYLDMENRALQVVVREYLEGHLRCINGKGNTILIGKDSVTVDCKRRK